MSAHTEHLIMLGVLNIPIYLVVGRVMFGSFAGFFACIQNGFNASYSGDYFGLPPNIRSHIKVMGFTLVVVLSMIYEDAYFFPGD